jgi:iron complex transport system substrate-binding protein
MLDKVSIPSTVHNTYGTRRQFLKHALAAAVAAPALGHATGHAAKPDDHTPRVIALDYGIATTLLAIGVAPVGVVSADRWHAWVREPELPPTVRNIGQDLAINMELVAALQPDMFFATPYTAPMMAQLQKIAPVHEITIYQQGKSALQQAFLETERIGRYTGYAAAAQAYIADIRHLLATAKQRVQALNPPPITMVTFMDARHARVFGAHSMYQHVMDAIGLRNGWHGATNYWGFRTIGLEQLAQDVDGDMELVVFEPVMPEMHKTLSESPLWHNLPVVQQDRWVVLPPVLMFGMLPSVARFIAILLNHLEEKYGS